jgi:hypothetical protein
MFHELREFTTDLNDEQDLCLSTTRSPQKLDGSIGRRTGGDAGGNNRQHGEQRIEGTCANITNAPSNVHSSSAGRVCKSCEQFRRCAQQNRALIIALESKRRDLEQDLEYASTVLQNSRDRRMMVWDFIYYMGSSMSTEPYTHSKALFTITIAHSRTPHLVVSHRNKGDSWRLKRSLQHFKRNANGIHELARQPPLRHLQHKRERRRGQ